jgi:hypothetical protein
VLLVIRLIPAGLIGLPRAIGSWLPFRHSEERK